MTARETDCVTRLLDCGHTSPRIRPEMADGALVMCWWDRCMTERRVVTVAVHSGSSEAQSDG